MKRKLLARALLEFAVQLGFYFWGGLVGRLAMAYIDWDMERHERRRQRESMMG